MDSFERFTEYAVELGCTELYEVVKTVEVVHDDNVYRFEVIRNVLEPQKGFDVRTYRGEGETWNRFHSAWIERDSPEGALMQSFSFFFGRNRNQQ